MAQPLVTVETVRDYIASRGGVVKNVELVRHFRLFLQQEDPERKALARSLFKDYVNDIAAIKLENGEKYLILKPHLQQEMGVTSGTKPPPLPPVEPSDSSDGGILSALSPMLFNQPTPLQQQPPTPREMPPPKEHSYPPPSSQEPRSPLQSIQQYPALSVTPPSTSSLPRAHNHPVDTRNVPKQGSAPPPPTARDSTTASEKADIKKMSASTDSLEKSGGLQSSVTKRIKAANSMARRSGSFNYADYRNSAAGRPPVAPPSGRNSPRGKGRINIPAGPGFDERRSVFENQTRRITLTPQQRRKAGQSLQLSIKNFGGSKDSNLAVVGTEGTNYEWDDTSSINTSGSAMEYEGLDPTEHEWINASTDADVDTIHRLLMVDPTLVNRKDFFMGVSVYCVMCAHNKLLFLSSFTVDMDQ
ncbi:ankyrin repeat domain-containing protein SOWAHA-like [Dysidea avara]|uniref:ankyrin repeat domain-containing protein SOWAHA-like n=1 Tax=Dysidea avara TaxID=196820 RepID=UPI003320440D